MLVGGLVALCVGTYGLLSGSPTHWLAATGLAIGGVSCGAALIWSSRGGVRTRYRPLPWDARATVVSAAGLATFSAALLAGVVAPEVMRPPAAPLEWPTIPYVMILGLLIAAVPVVVAPTPERS